MKVAKNCKELIMLVIVMVVMLSTIGCIGCAGTPKQKEIPWRPEVGDSITLGGYEWKVLSIENHRALLITKDVIALKPYNESSVPSHEGSTGNTFVPWGDSSLCSWLNGEFLMSFNATELARITNSELDGDSSRTYRVFILSPEAVEKYLPTVASRIANLNLPEDELGALRPAYPGEWEERQGKPYIWWVRIIQRTTYGYFPGNVVLDDGENDTQANRGLHIDTVGVRPALWLQVE